MPRPQKIWWWEARQEWCVKIDKVRHRLGSDKDEAERKFHELMANRPKPVDPTSVVALIDRFLEWTQKNRANGTYQWYQEHLQSFVDSLDDSSLVVGDMKVHHVSKWAEAMTCGDTVKRSAIGAVGRVFNWATEEGHIQTNPIPKLKKPAAESREQYVTDEEYSAIMKRISGPFRDVIEIAMETGARPQEITRVEAKYFDEKNSRWVFPVKESKGKKKKLQRIVYLSERAVEITKRAAETYRTGPIFRNSDGEPWTPFSLNCSFRRLQAQMGAEVKEDFEVPDHVLNARIKLIQKNRKAKGKDPLRDADVRKQARKALKDAESRKHAPKYTLYAFRHTYCTNGLKNGTDPVTMGKLMGHSDLTMIYKIYALIAKDPVFMLAAARKVKSLAPP